MQYRKKLEITVVDGKPAVKVIDQYGNLEQTIVNRELCGMIKFMMRVAKSLDLEIIDLKGQTVYLG